LYLIILLSETGRKVALCNYTVTRPLHRIFATLTSLEFSGDFPGYWSGVSLTHDGTRIFTFLHVGRHFRRFILLINEALCIVTSRDVIFSYSDWKVQTKFIPAAKKFLPYGPGTCITRPLLSTLLLVLRPYSASLTGWRNIKHSG